MRPEGTCRTHEYTYGRDPFLQTWLAYVLLGWLMAFPSYRLGLRPELAWVVFGVMALLGLYHARLAHETYKHERRLPESSTDKALHSDQ